MSRFDTTSRRDFVKQTALGALGAGVALGSGVAAFSQDAPRIEKRGDMVYRRLGRTNLMVSELAVGGSPSPDPAIFTEALDKGINLIDSSAGYSGGEERIGEVTEGRRDQVIISTKCHPYRMADPTAGIIAACETALGKLRTDYIDIWCIHGIGQPDHFLSDPIQAAFVQLKEQGKIRFAGVSCHSDPVGVLLPVIASGKLDVALLAFSVFSGSTVRKEDVDAGKVYDNWLVDSGLQGVLDAAKQHDVGLVAMKTMAGGARQRLDDFQADGSPLAQAKLKWVLSHDAVAAALSELLSYEILEENLAVVGKTLTPGDQALLRDHVREMSASVCRMCGTCQRVCRAGMPIPDILRCLTYHDVHCKPDLARETYADLAACHSLQNCRDCGRCQAACPHGLDIRDLTERAHRLLA